MIHIEHFTFNAFQTRCCLVWDDTRLCAIIDPGCASEEEIQTLVSFISENSLEPVCIMLTHAHFDHIYGMSAIAAKYGIPVYFHEEEALTIQQTNLRMCRAFGLPEPHTYPIFSDSTFTPNEDFKHSFAIKAFDGDVIEVGDLRFKVLGTPGHTRGGLSFYEPAEQVLFSGDTLFAGAIGRTDHPGGDYDQLMKSIFEKLMVLEGPVKVIPGHGPCTDIATERTTNPFLMPFNEPFED
jgi:glyoxylase-like metal-dependent hydrolase (beta-lactamase superfamily II)